ncbi:MAG: radical SAM protein [Gallionella sp.]|nr:radical SAM protein [Gallionella sp.]
MQRKNFKFMFVFFNDRMRTNIPLNIAYLTASLKNAGFSTCVFDTSFYKEHERISDEKKKEEAGIFMPVDYSSIGMELKEGSLLDDLFAYIDNEAPSIIGFSVFSQAKQQNFRLAKLVKERYPHIPIIMGGVHVNIEPKTVLAFDFVDYICIGEGEEAVVELSERLNNGLSVEGIKNIGHKVDGQLHINPLRPLIEMDKLPYLDYESFAKVHQYGPYRGKLLKMALVEATRTCPFGCSYCGNRIYKPAYDESNHVFRYRHKSPKRWVEEIKFYKENYGVEFLNIADGTYVAQNTQIFEELAPIYKNEVGIPFFCDATVHCINPRKVELLKEMGCVCVNMGLETGSEEYRKKYLNRSMTNEKIIQAFNLVKDSGMEVRSYNIIGLPFQTRKDIFDTIELNRLCNVDSVSMSIFMPYEGTPLREVCIENGLLDPNIEITGDGTTPIITNPHLADEELLGLYNTFAIYVKAPKSVYPQIALAEGHSPESLQLRKKLMDDYL